MIAIIVIHDGIMSLGTLLVMDLVGHAFAAAASPPAVELVAALLAVA